jgi:uncharacterized cupin superfamily protein
MPRAALHAVHVYSRDDEAFLLIDGQMTSWGSEERHRLLPGDRVHEVTSSGRS